MKRIVSVLLTFCMLLSILDALSMPVNSATIENASVDENIGSTGSYILGDVNGDGVVDIRDATLIDYYLSGLDLPYFNSDAADIDRDGNVSIVDSTLIKNWLRGENDNPLIGQVISDNQTTPTEPAEPTTAAPPEAPTVPTEPAEPTTEAPNEPVVEPTTAAPSEAPTVPTEPAEPATVAPTEALTEPSVTKDLVCIENIGDLICDIGGGCPRSYYKANNGMALAACMHSDSEGGLLGPILVGGDSDSVAYYTSNHIAPFAYSTTVEYRGSTYYVSSTEYFIEDKFSPYIAGDALYRCVGATSEAAALEMLLKADRDGILSYIRAEAPTEAPTVPTEPAEPATAAPTVPTEPAEPTTAAPTVPTEPAEPTTAAPTEAPTVPTEPAEPATEAPTEAPTESDESYYTDDNLLCISRAGDLICEIDGGYRRNYYKAYDGKAIAACYHVDSYGELVPILVGCVPESVTYSAYGCNFEYLMTVEYKETLYYVSNNVYGIEDKYNPYVNGLYKCKNGTPTEAALEILQLADESGDLDFINPSAYDHNFVESVTPPTCTEQGYTTYTCTDCGYSHKDNYVDAIGHSWSEWHTHPDYSSKLIRTCSVCEAADVRENTELWDFYGSANYIDESEYYQLTPNQSYKNGAMILKGGAEQNFSIELDYYAGARNGADGLAVAFYSSFPSVTLPAENAGGDLGIPKGFQYAVELDTWSNKGDSPYDNGELSSNHIGLIYQSVFQHIASTNLPESEDNKWHHLKIEVIDGVCRVFVGGNQKLSANVEYYGYNDICLSAACGGSSNLHAVKNINIVSYESTCDHNYVVTVIDPTCTEEGYTQHKCSLCGQVYKDDVVPALGHTYEITDSRPATCLKDGYAAYCCSRCSDTYTSTLGALGHNYIPEETEDHNHTVFRCSQCGDSYSNDIFFVTWIVDGESSVEQYSYKEMPSYKGSIIIDSDEEGFVQILGWDKEISRVESDAAYSAVIGSRTEIGGSCGMNGGNNIRWALSPDGTLTVSGSGLMEQYSSPSDLPWYNVREHIKSVQVIGNVLSVSDYAFSGCENLTEAYFGDCVESIGSKIFADCHGLLSVRLPAGLCSLSGDSFSDANSAEYMHPDLSTVSVTIPDKAVSESKLTVEWTVKNTGTVSTGNVVWNDTVYLIASDSFLPGQAIGVITVNNLLSLDAGEYYTNSCEFTLPVGIMGQIYAFVMTDAQASVFEMGEEDDNLCRSAACMATLNPKPDLNISNLEAAVSYGNSTGTYSNELSTVSKSNVSIRWTVANEGEAIANGTSWTDAVYLISEDGSQSLLLGRVRISCDNLAGYVHMTEGGYSAELTALIPEQIFGRWNITVQADCYRNISEYIRENNNSSIAANITLNPPADIAPEDVSVDESVISGDTLTISWRDVNRGAMSVSGKTWTDKVYISDSADYSSGGRVLLAQKYNVSENELNSVTVTIPQRYSGRYYIFIVADEAHSVFEYETYGNNTVSRPVDVEICPRPDLIVTDVKIGGEELFANENINVSYRVKNIGQAAAQSFYQTDSLYLVSSDDSRRELIYQSESVSYGIGEETEFTANFVLPRDIKSGEYTLFVSTDSYDRLFEENNDNNIGSVSVSINKSRYADLIAELTAMSFNDSTVTISYSVMNSGNIKATSWKDSISIVSGSDRYVLGVYDNKTALEPGESYSADIMVTIPDYINSGVYDFILKSDHYGVIDEENKTNNSVYSSSIDPSFTYARGSSDLSAEIVSVTDNIRSGETVAVTYSVTNNSSDATKSTSWTDTLYLLDESGKTVASASRVYRGNLRSGDSYTESIGVKVPDGISGTYSVKLICDEKNSNGENVTENNTAYLAQAVNVIEADYPDITVISVALPEKITAGQSFDLSYVVKNNGTAAAPGHSDVIKYRAAGMSGFAVLKNLAINTTTGIGKTYEQTVTLTLPSNIEGNCVFIVETNSGRSFFEDYSNSSMTDTAEVLPCPVAEICAANVLIPTEATPGKTITVKWDIINLSESALDAYFTDNIYISADDKWDSKDILVTQYNRKVSLRPAATALDSVDVTLPEYEELSKLTEQTISIVPGVKEGKYYIIVRADARNQIREEDEENNISASSKTLSVNMESIALGETKNLSLQDNSDYYYCLNIDGSLESAAAISVTGISENSAVEVYVKYGEIPTVVSYDKKVSSLNGSPDYIPFPITRKGNYYIYIREVGGTPSNDLKTSVSVENFGIHIVSPTLGGKGRVTVKLNGSMLDAGMRVYLIGENKSAEATKLYLIDSTTAYATFETAFLPNGIYDIKAISVYGEAVMEKAFTVADLQPGKLEINVSIPDVITRHSNVTGSVSWINSGYTDVYSPLLYLEGDGISFRSSVDGNYIDEELIFAYNALGLSGIMAHGEGGSKTLILSSGIPGEYTFNVYNYADIDMDLTTAELNADSAAGDIINNNFAQTVGLTAKDYAENVALMAAYMDQFGNTDYSIENLVAAYMLNADTSMLGAALATVTDISSIQLSLSRSFMSGVQERNTKGIFGYGWVTGYDITASIIHEDDFGGIIVSAPSGMIIFVKDEGVYKEAVYGLDIAFVDDSGAVTVNFRDGSVYTFGKDGHLSSISDANNNAVILKYQDGRLVALETGDGDRISFEYTGELVTKAYTDTDSVTYSYTDGYLTAVTGAYGTVSYEYDTASIGGRRSTLTKIICVDGVECIYEYDDFGRLTSSYIGEGLEKIKYIYSKTNEVTVIDAVGNRSVISYDKNGNIARTIGANGLVTGYTYDLYGRTSRVSLYDERNYFYSYNEYGDLISTADADGYSVYYDYDLLGNLTSVTDKRGITTEYLRDAKGNLTALVYADGSTEAYEYDSKGNVISLTDRMGHVTKYAYDGYSRIIRAEYYDGSYIAYTYDDNGNTVAIDENGDITSMTYDGYNNLISVTYPDGRCLLYAYDEYGRMTSVIDGDSDGTGYSYDEYGRTAAVTAQDGAVLTRYDYNADSSLYAVYNSNGTYTRYTYSNGLLKSIYNYGADDSVQSFFEYTYDRFGNISMMKTVEGIWTYEYDVIGQLLSVVSPSGEKTDYAYDLSGNKTSVTVNGNVTLYESNRLNQHVKIGDMSLYYDANGNLIRTIEGDVVTDYEYDVYGKLIRVSVSGTETAAYAYDAFGNRSKVTVDGVSTEYLNSPTGLGYAVAAYRNGQKTTYSWANGLVASKSGENSYFYSFNHLGSVIDITDASGAVVNHYAYDPYGLIIERSESVFNPFRYVGQYGIMDDDNGLWYIRARYVSQLSETFITVDPLGQYADLNVYRYAGNDTITFVDLNGESTDLIGIYNRFINSLINSTENEITRAGSVMTNKNPEPIFSSLNTGPDGDVFTTSGAGAGNNETGTGANSGGSGNNNRNFKGKNRNRGARRASVQTEVLMVLATISLVAILCAPGVYEKFNNHQQGIIDKYRDKWLNLKNLLPTLVGIAIGAVGFTLLMGAVAACSVAAATYLGIGLATYGIIQSVADGYLLYKDATWKSPIKSVEGTVVRPVDPNDILAPGGYGDAHWISPSDTLNYTIRFENDEKEATAPVRELVVTQQLDSDLDSRSFRITAFGFGEYVFTVPANTAFYQTRLDLTEEMGLYVDVSAGIDIVTGKVTYRFTAIDPQTGRIPDDPMVGFLPVNDENGIGEGFISYSVKAKVAAETGAEITEEAAIVFDYNEAINTPVVFNTVDSNAPTSAITSVSPVDTKTITITTSCSDNGSGIAYYDLYVSVNGGAYEKAVSSIVSSTVSFETEEGKLYRFYTVAVDNSGNIEEHKNNADAEYDSGYVPVAPVAPTMSVNETSNGAYITLNTDNGATLIYTTDGSEPTPQNASVYTDGVFVKSGDVFKACAVNGGMFSDVVTYNADIVLSNGDIILDAGERRVKGVADHTTVQSIVNLFNGTDKTASIRSGSGEQLSSGDILATGCVLTIDEVDYSIVIFGDVNGDGFININDVTTIQRHLAELDLLDALHMYAADVNRDGTLDISDATHLQLYLAEYDVQLG